MASNLEIVQESYEAFGRGDMAGLLSHVDPAVDWRYAGPSEIPWAGDFSGHEGVIKFFTAIGAQSEFQSFEPHTFLADGDNVVVLGRESVTSKTTGRAFNTEWAHYFKLKDGKVVAFREYTNTEAVAAAYR